VNPEAAAQWVNGLADAPRDEAVSAYSLSLSLRDPAAVLGWAANITNGGIRENAVQRILARWLSRSPSDATTWIRNSALPDAEKTRLLALPAGR
jgi:hypothetical protein